MRDLHTRREAASLLVGLTAIAGASLSPNASASAKSITDETVHIDARPEAIAFDPRKTAVIVIDMQNDFGAKGGMFDRAGIDITGIQAVVPSVRSALSAARAAGLPVIYLKMGFRADLSDAGPPTGPNLLKHAPMHVGQQVTAPDGSASRILVRDTWNTEIIPELRPLAQDVVLYKTRFSGFFNTDLHEILTRRGVNTLVVTGCTTSVCVESTVRDAMFRNYRCIILEDCAAEPVGNTAPRTNHEASLLTMQVLFAWISDSQKFARALAPS